MTRDVKVGVPVIDHFPVFEDDGYTKHSGLIFSDFTVNPYFNSAPSIIPVFVSEIGSSGEYEYTFVPVAEGVYDIQILIQYTEDMLQGTFLAQADFTESYLIDILNQCDKIDLAATLAPGGVFTGSLMDRLMNKDGSKEYNQGTDSLQGLRDTMGNPLVVDPTTLFGQLELVKALLQHNGILDNQTFAGGQLTSARLRVFDTPAHVPTMEGGSETVGKLAEFAIESSYDSYSLNKKFTLKRVYP